MERPDEQPREEPPPPVLPAGLDELKRDPAARLFAVGCALLGLAASLDAVGSPVATWIGQVAALLVVVALALLQLRWWRIKQYVWRQSARYWRGER